MGVREGKMLVLLSPLLSFRYQCKYEAHAGDHVGSPKICLFGIPTWTQPKGAIGVPINQIIGWAFVTEIHQNDNDVQNISGLNNYLYCYWGTFMSEAWFPAPPNPINKIINIRMNTLRVVCEHINVNHINFFHLCWLPRYLWLYKTWCQVRQLCLNLFFL